MKIHQFNEIETKNIFLDAIMSSFIHRTFEISKAGKVESKVSFIEVLEFTKKNRQIHLNKFTDFHVLSILNDFIQMDIMIKNELAELIIQKYKITL
jgi:hypothetical protein